MEINHAFGHTTISAVCTCNPALVNDEYKRSRVAILTKSSGTVAVDGCIADHIRRLWALGIETRGCCCGHGKGPAWVSVSPEHYERMFELGYQQYGPFLVNGSVHGLYSFYL